MRTYEEIVLTAAEIAIEENGGRKMRRYYYMIGHDSNEIRFEEFDGIQELADMHYDGDTRRALADDEYVFDQDEYDAWITEEI